HIADCLNDVDAYIRASSFKETLRTHDCIEIARRLVRHNRSQEALNYVETAMKDLDVLHPWYKDLLMVRIDALESNGDYVAAQNERVALFRKDLDTNVYNQILRHMPPELQDDFTK